jgi:hypothetical protein
VAPSIPYKSYEGRDIDWMPAVLAQGIPIGVTYGTGRLYEYERIAHMVSLVHLDDQLAGIVDNNAPYWVAWMPRAEFARRFTLGSEYGWAFYLNVPSRPSSPGPLPGPIAGTGGPLFWALAAAAAGMFGLAGLGTGALGTAAYLLSSDPESEAA